MAAPTDPTSDLARDLPSASLRSRPLSPSEIVLFPAIAHALRACVELDVFEHLRASPLPISELAARVGAEPRRLRQLLRAVAGTGLLASRERDAFALTADGEVLLRGHPSASRDLVATQMSPLFQDSLAHLQESVRTDRSGVAII